MVFCFPFFFSFSVCCCKKKKWPFYPLDSSPRNLVFSTLFYSGFYSNYIRKKLKAYVYIFIYLLQRISLASKRPLSCANSLESSRKGAAAVVSLMVTQQSRFVKDQLYILMLQKADNDQRPLPLWLV